MQGQGDKSKDRLTGRKKAQRVFHRRWVLLKEYARTFVGCPRRLGGGGGC